MRENFKKMAELSVPEEIEKLNVSPDGKLSAISSRGNLFAFDLPVLPEKENVIQEDFLPHERTEPRP